MTGVYLSIMTQALSYALMLAFFRNDMGFGGNNGFTDFKDILGFDLQQDATRVVLLVDHGAWRWRRATGRAGPSSASRAGRVIRAIRDAESRTRFLGYRVESYKLWVFVFSAVIAGVAGALYVPQVGIINPSEFAPINSIEVVIWVAVGGRGTLYGAVAGAVLVNYAKTFFTGALPEVWLYALGTLFVLVTLFLPRGIVGLLPARVGGDMNAQLSDAAAAAGADRALARDARGRRQAGAAAAARQDPLSRAHHRQLRRLQGAQRAHALRRSGRAALHHRPERRRQDDDDGRHHRARRARTRDPRGSAGTSTCCS